MSMSISYESVGRTNQKARTRDAIIAATRELLATGDPATVEAAADAAGVSRATAYRYFPNQRALLVATHPEIDAPSLLGADAPDDPSERFERVLDELVRMLIENEVELRTMLRLSLEPVEAHQDQLVLRQGRVIGWLEDALQGLEGSVPPAELRTLVYAIRCAVGIEALVWLCDVAQLSRAEAADVMKWSARALLHSVLDR